MKTYLNRKGEYVSKEPDDGYLIGKDKHGEKIYTGDKLLVHFRGKLRIELASQQDEFWFNKGILIK